MEASLPDSSSGNFSLVPSYLAVTGQTISANQHNPVLEDIAAAMSRRMPRDGRAPMLGNLQMNDYRVTGAGNAEEPQDYVTLAQLQAFIAAVAAVPVGIIVPHTSLSVPPGWLAANGQEVSRTTYPNLWAHAQASGNLGNQGIKSHGQFGTGNGSTTFTLPNLYADAGYFIRPMGAGRGIGSVQGDEFRWHGHGGAVHAAGSHSHGGVLRPGNGGAGDSGASQYRGVQGGTDGVGDHTHPLSIDGAGGDETRPRNIAYPFIIKT